MAVPNIVMDQLADMIGEGYVLMITNMTGGVETLVMGGNQNFYGWSRRRKLVENCATGTPMPFVALWRITTPFRALGVVNEAVLTPPVTCVERPQFERKKKKNRLL